MIAPEIDRLRKLVSTFYPHFERENSNVVEWSGTTVQAMHFDQIEPGLAPMPTVIDHEQEPPHASSLLSVFPGRASLWPQLAEMTRLVVLDKLQDGADKPAAPPWTIDAMASHPSSA